MRRELAKETDIYKGCPVLDLNREKGSLELTEIPLGKEGFEIHDNGDE